MEKLTVFDFAYPISSSFSYISTNNFILKNEQNLIQNQNIPICMYNEFLETLN